MANIIALVWDFDKTLVDGYMQDPIFEEKGVSSQDFWEEVNNDRIAKEREQGIKINRDTYYLNVFIREAREGGRFDGLNNSKLREYGKKIRFYAGAVDFFKYVKSIVENNSVYQEHDIKIECYIVSTGFKAIIEGSDIMKYTDGVWGCELIEEETNGIKRISEIAYSLDNTSKTRALFEINKGVGKNDGVDANTKMEEEVRRVRFVNMIYSADGPSDIPAFSVVNKNGGVTFGVYPRGNAKALENMERLRKDGRISHFAEADYSKGSSAYMWLDLKIREIADRIVEEDKEKIRKGIGGSSPEHLTS